MIYLVYGLSGPMKKLFTDLLREIVAFGANTDTSPDANWAAFNVKAMTRSSRFYDDGLVDVKHPEIKGGKIVKTARDAILGDKDRYSEKFLYESPYVKEAAYLPHTWYAINVAQIKYALDKKIDHFIVCNDVDTIIKISEEYGADKCKVIKIFIRNTQSCFKYLQDKYEELVKDKGEIARDIDLQSRVDKANKFRDADWSFDGGGQPSEGRKRPEIEKIDLYAEGEGIEAELQSSLLDILNKHSKNFDWKRLLTKRRIFDGAYKVEVFDTNPKKPASEADSILASVLEPFIDDYNQISALSSFRRMQDKCQVFPLKRYDYARTRLTHSIEVAATAEALGDSAVRFIREKYPHHYDRVCRGIPTLLKNAALLHDMGNPPFGHFSEDAIRRWFEKHWGHLQRRGEGNCQKIVYKEHHIQDTSPLGTTYENDLKHYEGNAQLFRLVTTLADLGGNENKGYYSPNLTMASIATTIKYPTRADEIDASGKDICKKKNGYFDSEKEYFEKINKELGLNACRHPLAFLLEAADDITYYASDLEDALKRKLVSLEDLLRETTVISNVASCVLEALQKNALEDKDELISKCDVKCGGGVKEKVIKHLYAEFSENGKDVSVIETRTKLLEQLIDEIKGKIKSINNVGNDKIAMTSRTDLAYKELRAYIKKVLLKSTQKAFGNKYNCIMARGDGNFKGELLNVSEASLIKIVISNILVKYVYHSRELVHNQLKAAVALDTILCAFVKAALKLGFDEETLIKNNPEDITDINVFLLFSDNYRLACRRANRIVDDNKKIGIDEKTRRKAYNCIMLAMDVFAGMTDSYAMEIYHLLTASL